MKGICLDFACIFWKVSNACLPFLEHHHMFMFIIASSSCGWVLIFSLLIRSSCLVLATIVLDSNFIALYRTEFASPFIAICAILCVVCIEQSTDQTWWLSTTVIELRAPTWWHVLISTHLEMKLMNMFPTDRVKESFVMSSCQCCLSLDNVFVSVCVCLLQRLCLLFLPDNIDTFVWVESN